MSLFALWNSNARKKLWGDMTKLMNLGESVRIGSNFKCDSIPNIWRTAVARVEIGDNVHMRNGVEIRAHQNSHIIIGDNVRLDRGVRILATENAVVHIHSGCSIGLGTVLNGKESITIGKNVLISGYVYIQTSMHRYDAPGAVKHLGNKCTPVVIEEGAWIGAHAIVMPGTTIGKGAVLGANAVLTKNAENNAIYAGVPAKLIRKRFD